MSSLPRGSKLGVLDDLPIHQHANVISQPASDQWNWTERWYFNLQRRSGELVGIIGGGVFRNTAITESYFCFQNGDYQFNTRTTRAVAAKGGKGNSKGAKGGAAAACAGPEPSRAGA